MFVYNETCSITPCELGVTRKVLAYDKALMMCEVSFELGAQGNMHSHKHSQITYVAKGSFQFTVGEEIKIVSEGDSIFIPPNAIHGVTCLSEGKLIDVFNPMREDFVN